ncbi:MAG: hypothetical protein N2C14_31535, partial [Planctomycetales bacterium]
MASNETTVDQTGSVPQHDQFIHQQVGKTQEQLKIVELIGELMVLLVGLLAYLLGMVIVDHWFLAEGFCFWGRGLALLGLIGGGSFFVWRRIVPLVTRKINPIFAASAIEGNEPALKNSLINFLLLRGESSHLPPIVYREVENRAAHDLTQISVDSAVDRSRVIRIGYALTVLVAVMCLYKLISPKDPLASVGRVMFPWIDVAVPTRVEISEVSPGDMTQYAGENLVVTAMISGLSDGERAVVRWSSTDGTLVDQEAELRVPTDKATHRAELPGTADGLAADLEYYLQAGDARTPVYKVQVRPAPSVAVESVRYEYPAYTGLSPRTEKIGDVIAPEGTKITVEAVANQEVQQHSAVFLFNKDERRLPIRLKVDAKDPTRLRGSFTLSMKADGSPSRTSYQIRFHNTDDHENSSPIRYKIRTLADEAPEIQFVAPAKTVQVPLDGSVPVTLEASDDYGLAQIQLRIQRGGEDLLKPEQRLLLSQLRREDFHGEFKISPRRLGASVGDVLVYWAEATDNKQPRANESRTGEDWKIEVGPPANQPENPRQDQVASAEDQQNPIEQQPREKDPSNQQPSQDQPKDADADDSSQPDQPNEENDQQGEQEKSGEQGSDDGQEGEEGDQESESFEDLLKRAQEQKKQKQDEGGEKSEEPNEGGE